MASCTVASNLTIACADDQANAGLGKMYLAFVNQIDTSAITYGSTDHSMTAVGLLDSAVFVELEGRFELTDYSSTSNRDNYGTTYERTLNAFFPNLTKERQFILDNLSKGKKLFLIVSGYESTGTEKRAFVFGWDKKLGADGGAMLNINEIIAGEVSGQNGANAVFTAKTTELLREFVGTITVEDGSTGTDVSFGA